MASQDKLVNVTTLEGHQERVWCIAWNPSGTLLASTSTDKSIRIWGQEGVVWVCKTILTDSHNRTIRSVSWSPCGNLLAAASFDGTVSIWDKREDFQCKSVLEGHENEVKSVSWSQSGSLLATCGRDKSVWIWEVLSDGEEFECASVLQNHSQDVKMIKWHPTEEILASASYDDTIKMYKEDDDDWSCCCTLEGHSSTVWSISFEGSGKRLGCPLLGGSFIKASCSADQTVRIWKEYQPGNNEGIATPQNEAVWKCVCTISGDHLRPIYSIDWSPLTGLIATGGGDDIIRIYREDVTSGSNHDGPNFSLVWTEKQAHSTDINCVAWNPVDSKLLATCSDDRTIKLWNFH